MGNNSSRTQNLTVSEEEQTLSVSPHQLAAVCSMLARAQVQVIATSVPNISTERSTMWVKSSENLKALIAAGALGEDVEPSPYVSKGSKVTSLEDNTTVIGMKDYCAKMLSEGIDVVACSSLAELGNKKIYHF